MTRSVKYKVEQIWRTEEQAFQIFMRTDDDLVTFMWSEHDFSDEDLDMVGRLMFDHVTISNQISVRHAG